MSLRGRRDGKLSVLSPEFVRGKDRWSAPESTAGKLSVLSADPAPSVPAPPGSTGSLTAAGPTHELALPGWLAAAGPPPHAVALPGWLAAAGPPPHALASLGGLAGIGAVSQGGAPRGLLGRPAVGTPGADEALASAGGTARKESVISQGGTPVFGRVLPAAGFAAVGFAAPRFDAPGLAAVGSAALVPG